jgi:hypothetical protein
LGTPCKFLFKNLTPFLRDDVERRLLLSGRKILEPSLELEDKNQFPLFTITYD